MKGYKAFDKNLRCKGFQFEIGVWHEHPGPLELCKSGFHFCKWPSGPWTYYPESDTRIFEVEAENVLDIKEEPGADFKLVAAKIKLLKEITPTGYSNTGKCNTGDRNTGNRNTGNSNTGDWNTGNWNTGDRNTGNRNTGNSNTGDWNTGYSNTGYSNTGDCNTGSSNTGNCNTGSSNTGDCNTGSSNTGDCNTGSSNTGNRNTGDCNTGDCNTTNFSAGFFCQVEPKVISFDMQTEFTRQEFSEKFPEISFLGVELSKNDQIDFQKYKNIPGITEEKLKTLHQKFIDGRKKKGED